MGVQPIWLNKSLNFLVFSICLITLLGLSMERVAAEEPRLGLKGYDPVAYFTMARPVEGNPQFQYVFDEVRYHFVSEKHLELFRGEPDKYAPRYNGLCTMGLGAKGYKIEANPENWVIHNEKLYLTQRSFGPAGFRKAPDRWAVAALAHEQVLSNAPIGTGISWW
jgi:YHS domain-containing protein